MENEPPIDILLIDESVGTRQLEQLRRLRESRDNGAVRSSLEQLRKAAAANDVNMMPYILDCVRTYATLGEICDEFRSVYGVYEEPTF
jgi:methylmalonyl-CoA mutase N-terminal domain/subunit